uniref:RING-type domain-containing protein n=1 Tax=Aegilops tauschii subsp. strangulata TaxID=200361 RepID=A0A453END5_AEGTS
MRTISLMFSAGSNVKNLIRRWKRPNVPKLVLKAKSCKSSDMVNVASDIKTSKSLPSTPPLVSRTDPSSSRCHSLHVDSFSMRKARRSPGHQLCRQISDGKIPSLKSFSESSYAGGRPSSSMLSTYSNDPFGGGSQHGGSSDGWSTRTFSDLVASSQRERWSVDSELFGSISSKIARSNDSHATALSPDEGICKLCSKLLKERSTWSAHDLGVVAVLFCGHAYHANCLDSTTCESEKYDPPCPVCTHGEKGAAKLFGKLDSKIKSRKSKNVMSDTDIDRISKHKRSMREPRLGTSSSMKDSFRRPFLKRHFSIGSRPPRSVLGSEPTGKKGFWARHWRE